MMQYDHSLRVETLLAIHADFLAIHAKGGLTQKQQMRFAEIKAELKTRRKKT